MSSKEWTILILFAAVVVAGIASWLWPKREKYISVNNATGDAPERVSKFIQDKRINENYFL